MRDRPESRGEILRNFPSIFGIAACCRTVWRARCDTRGSNTVDATLWFGRSPRTHGRDDELRDYARRSCESSMATFAARVMASHGHRRAVRVRRGGRAADVDGREDRRMRRHSAHGKPVEMPAAVAERARNRRARHRAGSTGIRAAAFSGAPAACTTSSTSTTCPHTNPHAASPTRIFRGRRACPHALLAKEKKRGRRHAASASCGDAGGQRPCRRAMCGYAAATRAVSRRATPPPASGPVWPWLARPIEASCARRRFAAARAGSRAAARRTAVRSGHVPRSPSGDPPHRHGRTGCRRGRSELLRINHATEEECDRRARQSLSPRILPATPCGIGGEWETAGARRRAPRGSAPSRSQESQQASARGCRRGSRPARGPHVLGEEHRDRHVHEAAVHAHRELSHEG